MTTKVDELTTLDIVRAATNASTRFKDCYEISDVVTEQMTRSPDYKHLTPDEIASIAYNIEAMVGTLMNAKRPQRA